MSLRVIGRVRYNVSDVEIAESRSVATKGFNHGDVIELHEPKKIMLRIAGFT